MSVNQKYIIDPRFRMLKMWTPQFIRPKRDLRLYVEIPSDSASDTEIIVQSGSGTDTLTTAYIAENEIAWVESMGLEVEMSSSPDVSWNANKSISYEIKYYDDIREEYITASFSVGGSASEDTNWRMIHALSETQHHVAGFKKNAKDVYRYDFVALDNFHYWFVNIIGDEYVKVVADAGIFTYTSDVPILFLQGVVFDYEYLRSLF